MSRLVRFSVPFNGDVASLHGLYAAGARSFYGQATVVPWGETSAIGAGRAAISLAPIPWETLVAGVAEARRLGAEFEYLLNDPVGTDVENSESARRVCISQLKTIEQIGVARVKVAHPVVSALALRHTELKVGVSKFVRVRSPQQARQWQDLGVSGICLEPSVVRDLDVLHAIRTAVSCELEVLANDACLGGCPYALAHATYSTQHCREDSREKYLHYYSLRCLRTFLRRPANYMQATFIRPEDVGTFAEAGVDWLKLTDRAKSSDWLRNALEAFGTRAYHGNVVDLLPLHSAWGTRSASAADVARLRPGVLQAETRAVHEFWSLLPALVGVHIDHEVLEHQSELLRQRSCSTTACGTACRFCAEIAPQAVRFTGPGRAEAMELLEAFLERSENAQQ